MSNPLAVQVLEAVKSVIPADRFSSGTGWVNVNCPACRDTRKRGGFIFTPSGGFRYKCFNGGCRFEEPTGWEPEYGFAGRVRRIFELFGGNALLDLPWQYNCMQSTPQFDTTGNLVAKEELEAVYSWPEMALPKGCELLAEAKDSRAEPVREYVRRRGEFLLDKYPLCWTPVKPRYVIIPCVHYKGKIVGWIGRRADYAPEEKGKHLNNGKPKHYMLNQHLIHDRSADRIIVVQGAFDAIALNGLSTFGARIDQKQINLLKNSGKDIVLLPDYKGIEWESYLQAAQENDFYISCPEWPGADAYSDVDAIKDAGESILRNGLLGTLVAAVSGITKDYYKAEAVLKLYSGRKE